MMMPRPSVMGCTGSASHVGLAVRLQGVCPSCRPLNLAHALIWVRSVCDAHTRTRMPLMCAGG